MRRPWTRSEKWLFAAPLLLAVTTLVGLQSSEAIRKARGYPLELATSPTNSLTSISLSANGQVLAAGEQFLHDSNPPAIQAANNTIYLWDAHSLSPLPPLTRPIRSYRIKGSSVKGIDDNTYGIALSPDAKMLAWSSPQFGFAISDLKTPRVLWTDSKHSGENAAFSPDGKLLALGGGAFRISHALTGKVVTGWQPRPQSSFGSFQFSPQGHWFASTGPLPAWEEWKKAPNEKGGEIELRRTTNWKVERVFPLPNTHIIAFSPDERTLVGTANLYDPDFSTKGSRLCCFDVATGKIKWELDSRSKDANPVLTFISDACFSPDSATVAVMSLNRPVFLLDAKTGEIKRTFSIPAAREPNCTLPHALAFSPDGKRLFTRGKNAVLVWDLR